MRVETYLLGFVSIMLFGCSTTMMSVERPVADGYLQILELSDDGIVEQKPTQLLKLPVAVAGKSDIVARNQRIYVGTYKTVCIIEQSEEGVMEVASVLEIPGYDVALALHPVEEIVYIVNSEGVWVVDVADIEQPRLVEHLRLIKEMDKIRPAPPIRKPIGTDVACEDGKLAVTIQGDGESPTLSRAGTILVFDLSIPRTPRLEKILDSLSGAAAVAMGIFKHQLFAVGDKIVEYQDFKPMEIVWSWLRAPKVGVMDAIHVPGNVVDTQFIFGPRDIVQNPEKHREIVNQYRRGSPLERQRLQTLTPLDHGTVYIATEHVVTYMTTNIKAVFWGPTNTNDYISDRFNHIYGMAARGYEQVYLAAGTEGVYFLKQPPIGAHLRTHARYKDLPSPAIDVYVSDDSLYILCGELHLKNVQHNEHFGVKQ